MSDKIDIKKHLHQAQPLAVKLIGKLKTEPQDGRFKVKQSIGIKDDEKCYPTTSSKRGLLVTFTMHDFAGDDNRPDALMEELVNVFQQIGFEVKTFHNSTQQDFVERIEEIKNLDLASFDCFFLSVSTHGDEGTPEKHGRGRIITSDRKPIAINYILSIFSDQNCPQLVGKPKIFIFPVCRGAQTEGSIVVKAPKAYLQSSKQYDEPSNDALYTLHDTKVLFSSKMGYKSFSNPKVGSWFIYALCEALAEYAHILDFSSIVTEAEFIYSTRQSGDNSRKSCSENFAFQRYLFLNPGLKYIP